MSDKVMQFAEDFSDGSEAAWQDFVSATLKGKPFEKVMQRQSFDGLTLDSFVSRETTHIGPQPVRSHGNWAMISPNWANDAAIINTNLLEDLEKGASGVAVTLDPVAHAGIAPNDLPAAFADVYLNMVPFTLIQGADALEGAKAMLALLDARDYDNGEVKGCMGVDPIGALARFGYLPQPAEAEIEQAALLAQATAGRYPHVATFVADGTVYANAGAPAVQELTFALSTAVTYLRAMEAAGMPLEAAARQIHFTLSASADIWTTIAKFRTLRRVWASILEACGVTDVPATINGVSAVYMSTMKDPWVNILRGTAACFAAGVGGADSITVLPHDLMLGTTDKFSRRIARNIQIILQEESNLSQVTDPAAGSYALEKRTHDMTEAVTRAFQTHEINGGTLTTLRNGRLKGEIDVAAEARSVDLRKRKIAITGVSEFPNIDEKPTPFDDTHTEVDVTVPDGGEGTIPLGLKRLAGEYEALRFKSDHLLETTGKRPQIFLANLGSPAEFTARATFAKNFFEAGGVQAQAGLGANTPDEIAAEFKASGAPYAVLCGTDGQYETMGQSAVAALKAAGCTKIYIAGRLSEPDNFYDAGLSEMIFIGCDLIDVLERAHSDYPAVH